MIKKNVMLMSLLALVISIPVSAATLLQYEFEKGLVNTSPVDGDLMNESGSEQETIPDLSGNGNNMWVLSDSTTLAFSSDTPFGAGLSMECTGSPNHGFTSLESSLATWSPIVWSIECSVKLNNLDGWYTLIGRDLSSEGGNPADLYFQKNDENDQFRINYYTVGGNRHVLDTGVAAVANQWYNVLAASDGYDLVIYVDALDGNGYQAMNTLDISSLDTPANNAIATLEDNWTFGRGYYNGSTDYMPGFLDNISFRDTAIAPASAPSADVINSDGSYGVYDQENETVDVTLNFNGSIDPNNVFVDSVTAHYIYMSTAEDPNIYHVDTVTADGLEGSYVVEGLAPETVYYWAVEEAINGAAVGNAANVKSMTWSFQTAGPSAIISSGPFGVVADPDATLVVNASPASETFKWFKVVGEQDAEGGESDDIELAETAVPSYTFTPTLADEGDYYCIAYNNVDLPSDPSAVAHVWTARLIGHWNFEDDLTDSVAATVAGATVHDGSVVEVADGTISYQAGIDGQAVVFNNDGDYVTIEDSAYFNFFNDQFTLNIWYKNLGTAGWALQIAKLDPGSAGWLLGTVSGDAFTQFIFDVPYARIDSTSEVDVNDGEWHMLSMTYSSADEELSCYADGIRSGVVSNYVIGNVLPAAPLTIGAIEGGASINGAIDDVKIYSMAMSQAEIADMYLAAVPDAEFCFSNFVDEFDYDFNNDCKVDILDFAMFTDEWLGCQRYPADLCEN